MDISAHVLTLSVAEVESLGGLRLAEGIDVAEGAELIWLRVSAATPIAPEALLKIPALERRLLAADGKLYAAGNRLPTGRLPSSLQWAPLRDWLSVGNPEVYIPARPEARSRLRLETGGNPREADALLLTLAEFEKHAAVTSDLRLHRWKFAVHGNGDVLVWGAPIPSLPGRRFSVEEGLAVPLGCHWTPRLSARAVAKVFKLRRGDLLLWESDQQCVSIPSEQWLPVSRAAVRASLESLE